MRVETLPDGRILERREGVTVTYCPDNPRATLRRHRLHGNDHRQHKNAKAVHEAMKTLTGRV